MREAFTPREDFTPPKRGTAAYKIAEFLCNVGPASCAEIINAMIALGIKEKTARDSLDHVRDMGWAIHQDKKYEPVAALRQHFHADEPSEIVQPRTVSAPRPLQAKYIPSLNPLIADRLRTDSSYKTSDISLAPFRGTPI